MKVLGISTSPRLNGNSDLLLQRALAGAESAGAEVEYVRLSDFEVGPCIECNSCFETGVCVIEDDYQQLLGRMLDADRLVFAIPVFFMSACAQAKMLIDRGQCLWAAKYILKKSPVGEREDRRAMVIAVGSIRSGCVMNPICLSIRSMRRAISRNTQRQWSRPSSSAALWP